MAIILLWLVLVGALAWSERRGRRVAFAITALAATAAALLVVAGDMERATLLAAILAIGIVGASQVKYHHSGIKLTASDLSLVFAGTIPFLLVQYRRAAIAVLAVAAGLVLGAIWVALQAAGPPVVRAMRFVVFAAALASCVVAYRAGGGAKGFRAVVTAPDGYYSTFMASLIDMRSWRTSPGLSLSDIAGADSALALTAAIPARSTVQPDIIVIQHESLFDPRIYGLPVGPEIEAFLSPPDGLSGPLNVDIYGGGSWQSEFSLLTGLSSALFGPDAYFIFRKGAGRFRHGLPHALTALGYDTMLVSSCRRNFLDYDAFYRSIGFGTGIFSDDLPGPFDVARFEQAYADAMFLPAALREFSERMPAGDGPRFLYALTNFNHGPHDRRLVPSGCREAERAFARAACPDDQYGEYYARLSESAAAWQRVKAELATKCAGRPALIVHYGDHQPVMTRRIERHLGLPDDERRKFRTFYALEGLNFDIDRAVVRPGALLDIAFLGTVAMQIAGLPLDPISATRASLLGECGEAYFATPSERKSRFHRTLVDMGLIDVAPIAGR